MDTFGEYLSSQPQVGAILHLNTNYPVADPFPGNKDWFLDGSCVLVQPDRVLTIGHVVNPCKPSAAFFPGEGLFPLIDEEAEYPRYASGDNLALVRLGERVEHAPPLWIRKIREEQRRRGFAFVSGFGRWSRNGAEGRDGLQRRVRVKMGMPRWWKGQYNHYDNLDLCWWSLNNVGLSAQRNNSGGPIMWSNGRGGFDVIGVNREVEGECKQVGAWIGRERRDWLRERIGARPDTDSVLQPIDRAYRPFEISADGGEILPFDIPPGTAAIKATVNATAGLRLQAKLVIPAPVDDAGRSDLLATTRADCDAAGSFLFRAINDIAPGSTTAALAVAPCETARPQAEKVHAQANLLFLP